MLLEKDFSQRLCNLTLTGLAVVMLSACGGGSSSPAMQGVELSTGAATAPSTTGSTTTSSVSVGLPPSSDTVVTPNDGTTAQPAGAAAPVNLSLVENAGNIKCEAPPAQFSETMTALVNATRSAAQMCGASSHAAAPTVTWSGRLAAAAEAHANDMAANNFFAHNGSDGLDVADRVEAFNYTWRAVGENIAAGQLDQAEVHTGWVDSPGHCKNIMSNAFTEIGAACVLDSNTDFETYWVVVFGDARVTQ